MDSLLTENGLRDEDCCKVISDYHLKKISNSVCKDWRLLPSYLEMEEIVVSDIEHDCKDLEERVKRHKFLSTWKSQKGSAATYKKLMEALLEMKCKSEAEKVCKIVRQLSNDQEDPINAEGIPTQAVSEASNALLDSESPIYKDLKQQLNSNLQKIHTQYASYVSTIRNCLEEKITYQELRAHLRNMPVFLKNDDDSNKLALLSCMADKLKRTSSIDEIFDILDTECCSFLDFALYESLIKHYNLDEGQEHLKYMTYVTNYLYGHTVTEFMMINPGLLVRSDILEKLSFKFNFEATCKLARITELKTAIAKILGLHESGLQLFDIREGCVGVTFLISKPVSQQLFFGHETVLTSECISELEKLSILWIKLNEDTLLDVTKLVNCEGQGHTSPSGEKRRSKSTTERSSFQPRSYNNTGKRGRSSSVISTKDTLEAARKRLEELTQTRKEATSKLPPDPDSGTGSEVLKPSKRSQPYPDSGTGSEVPSNRSSLLKPSKKSQPYPDSGTGNEVPSNRSSILKPSKRSQPYPDSGTGSEAPSNRSSLLKPSKKRNSDIEAHLEAAIEVPSDQPTSNTSSSRSRNNLIRDIIQRQMETFMKSTNFNALKSHFPSTLLSTNAMKHLEALKNDKIRNEQFYMIFLPWKRHGTCNKLFECLKSEQEHSGHKDLVEIIEKELKENTS